MSRTAEQNIDKGKEKAILMVDNRKSNNNNKKPNIYMVNGNDKEVSKLKHVTRALNPRSGMAKESNFFHCGKTKDWKKIFSKYIMDIRY